MSRIRSIHPGFFTDEDIVLVSISARFLLLGLGTEADDKGVFLWKPTTLKMRLFPVDNVDMTALLSELQSVDMVRKYEIGGRHYGAIRNFRKHQRPKSPNDIHVMPDDFRNYVGLSHVISETPKVKRRQFPQNGEINKQMEDGGWMMEEDALSREKVSEVVSYSVGGGRS